MVFIVRELSKLCMFAIVWLMPVMLSRWNGSNQFLWLFILSLLVTAGLLSHYEELERMDEIRKQD